MCTLANMIPLRQPLWEQAPTLGASLLIANLFDEFYSFPQECVAFLATWYVLGAVSRHADHPHNPFSQGHGETIRPAKG